MTDDLAARLETLRANVEGRSQTARLADHFEDIERTLGAGVSRVAILEQLHEVGFTMNMKAFDVAMYRLRKRRDRILTVPATPPGGTSPVATGRTQPPLPVVRPTTTAAAPGQGAATALQDDWRTCRMTAEEMRALTPEQRKERRAALQELAFPTLRPLASP